MCQDGDLEHKAPLAWRRLSGEGQTRGRGGYGLERKIVRKLPKPVPEKVAKMWAEEWAKEGEAIDWEKLMPPRGF